jgi:flagellar hook-associated protein 1 FlgK
MSIAATLASALSGLSVNARRAELIAGNIANATTEGYGRREAQLVPLRLGSTGQGVAIGGIERQVDRAVLADRRLADAAQAGGDARAGFLTRIEQAIGSPDAEGSLTARLAAFDAALVAAASRPDSEARLETVADTGRLLARGLNGLSDTVQEARARADADIAQMVASVNAALSGVAELNAQILRQTSADRDASALVDQRQTLIDSIAEVLPLVELDRGRGQVALYTTGGAALLDGTKPFALGFEGAGFVEAGMTLASGALSGLTLNGRAVPTGEGGPLSGGALSAAFAVRDDLGPEVQAQLDALAYELAARTGPGGPDTTLTPGAAGLFTDAGAAADAGALAGLAGRLRLNAAADPDAGGEAWRLRDGLAAAAPGAAGDPRLLSALQSALAAVRVPQRAELGDAARSLADLGGLVTSRLASDRLTAEGEAAFATARAEALRDREAESGVDTDREIQDLLVVEKAYAANAQVLRTVDEMLDQLMRI